LQINIKKAKAGSYGMRIAKGGVFQKFNKNEIHKREAKVFHNRNF